MLSLRTPANLRCPNDEVTTGLDLELVVEIQGLQLSTVIGIHSDETYPQPLILDLDAGMDHATACQTDEINETLDYSVLHARIHELMQSHGARLLERLAWLIANLVIEEFGARWARVRLIKPNKLPDVAALGVTLTARRSSGQESL